MQTHSHPRSLRHPLALAALALTLASAQASTQAQAGPAPVQKPSPSQGALERTSRIVVKYKAGAALAQGSESTRVNALSKKAGVQLKQHRITGQGASVFELPKEMSLKDARAVARRIADDPSVEYAEPDVRVKPLAAPQDPFFSSQWQLAPAVDAAGGGNFTNAWARSTGTGAVVAVIDTGSVSHADLAPNEINGYDFVSDPDTAGDGNGRDADASDPGDFCASEGTNSSWHGLKVASQIAAVANNNQGISGAAPNARILQVRALGRCGGYLSDVADAVVWAAGGANSLGLPVNANPAKVLNLSLGSPAGTPCMTYMQDAVNHANDQGSVVVAAAGNETEYGSGIPAACTGVLSVGAHTRSADLASYSNYGPSISLTAPGGGGCRTQTAGCLSTPTVSLGNAGATTPGANQDSAYFAGTSSAAPHVAAAAALLVSARPELTPAQVRTALLSTAKPHAAGSYCALNPGHCGTGMLDADAALESAGAGPLPPVLSIPTATRKVPSSATVQIQAVVQNPVAPITYSWSQVSGPAVSLTGADQAQVSFTAPSEKTAPGAALVFQVQVSLGSGDTLTETATVQVDNAPVAEAPPASVAVGEADIGKPFKLALAGTDADGDSLEFVLLQGPLGMRVETVDGVSSIVWDAPVSGTYTVRYVVQADGLEGTPSQFTLVVGNGVAAPAPGNNAGEGGGGGGSFGVGSLALLAALGAMKRKRRETVN